MPWAKQSTAVLYIVGPILDSAGAEYASAVIGDLSLSKNGGTLTALASAASLTYVANGYYTLALTTTNTNTLGENKIICNKSTYQMPPLELMVLPAATYDALVTNAAGTANGLLLALANNKALTEHTIYRGTLATVTSQSNVTLASDAPATANALINCVMVPVGGLGAGQRGIQISGYTSGRVCTLSFGFGMTIDTTTVVAIMPASVYVEYMSSTERGTLVAQVWSASVAGLTSGIGQKFVNFMAGITSLANWLGLISSKHTGDSTARTELRATGAGSGTYDETTDSLEAQRDNLGTNGAALSLAKGTQLTGFNDLAATGIRSAVGMSSANLDSQLSLLSTTDQLNSAVWAQTRFRFSIPEKVEVPQSGNAVYVIGINTYNSSGVLTNLDANPTVHAYYNDGTSADSLLGSVSHPATGCYEISLTIAAGTTAPQFLRFTGTGAMSSVNLGMSDYTWIMDDISPDFSSADRAKLDAIKEKTDPITFDGEDNINANMAKVGGSAAPVHTGGKFWVLNESGNPLSTFKSNEEYVAVGGISSGALEQIAGIEMNLGKIKNTPVQVDTGSEGVISFVSGAYVATAGDTLNANLVQVDGENVDSDGNGKLRVQLDETSRDEVAAAVDEQLSETHGDGSWEGSGGGGGGGDCPTVDQIGDDIESRFTGRALIIPSPLGGNAVQILGGSDYESETTFLEIPKPANATWPDLSTGEWDDIRFVARIAGEDIPIGTGSVVTPTGSSAKVKVAFTNAETDQLREADGENDVCTIWALKGGKKFALLHRELDVVQTAWEELGT